MSEVTLLLNLILCPTPYRWAGQPERQIESEFFIENLLIRIYLIIEMIWWTGLAPWEFEKAQPVNPKV